MSIKSEEPSIIKRGPLKFVVILGWNGSLHAHFKKYSQFYRKWGYYVVMLQVEPMSVFKMNFDPKRETTLQETCLQIVKLIQEKLTQEKRNDSEVIVHTFSNGGFEYYTRLVDKIYKDPNLRIVASIFDSAPAMQSLITISRVLSVQFKNKIISNLVYCLSIIVTVILIIIRRLFLGPKTDILRLDHMLISEPYISMPMLFLYSMEDQITSGKGVEEFIQKLKERNSKVTWHCFTGTTHVAHLHYKPSEYIESVGKFLSKISSHYIVH